jgi:hypothetical protein
MDAFLEYIHRFWTDMVARSDGPESFRFFLQPTMALLMALRDGIRDAKAGRQPYYVQLRDSGPEERKRIWREGVSHTARILLLGVAMDVIYQFKVFGGFRYPNETFVIAIVLAFLPYLLLRGPITRIARNFVKVN